MTFDGIYTPNPDPDPIAGVTLTRVEFRLLERQSTVELTYWTKSGAAVASVSSNNPPIHISQDEHDKFAGLVYVNVRGGMLLGAAVIAALVTLNRIPNVQPAPTV